MNITRRDAIKLGGGTLGVASMLGLAACGGSSDDKGSADGGSEKEKSSYKVALVNSGPMMDGGWGQGHLDSLKKALEAHTNWEMLEPKENTASADSPTAAQSYVDQGVDLIIGCGDLSRHYMNFLSDAAPVPVLYVHGNHDASYDREPPRGAICIDDDLYWYKGYRIVGLGGSCRYRAGAWQFTEAEMKRRISHLRSKIQHAGGVDILVTHAPLHGYGDFSDLPHRGFTVFNEILDTYHPALMLHGHIHLTYGANIPREHQYGQTRIVNCYERFTLDLPDKPDPRRHSLIERWKQFNRTGHF